MISLLILSCNTTQKSPEIPSYPILSIEGENNSFSLILDKNGRFYFSQKDPQLTFTAPTANVEKAMDADVRRYRSLGEDYELIANIIKIEGSQGLPAYKAGVQYKEHDELNYTELTGTAIYTIDSKLYNIWLVKAVDGKTVSAEDFSREVPVIEMNSSKGSFMGNTGCNRISGTFSTRENMIYFGHSMSTRMACEKGEVSSRIAMILGDAVYDYSFEGRELILSKRGVELIRFINVD